MAKSKRQQRIRNMYSKMASGIRQRAKQLQKEYGPWLKSANDAMSMFKPLRQMGPDVTSKDLRRAMKQMQRLRPELYKKEIEKNLQTTVNQLQNAGYSGIDRSNILAFLGMMENTYYKALAKIYGSPEVAMQINKVLGGRKPMSQSDLILNMKDWAEKIGEDETKAKKLNLRHGYGKPPKKSSSRNYG